MNLFNYPKSGTSSTQDLHLSHASDTFQRYFSLLKYVWRDHHPISKRHNSSIWKSIVCELNKLLREQGIGSIHTGNQCKAKIQNLEDKYKHIKDQNNKSGNDHKTFTSYKELNKILGCHPKITPKSIIDCGFEDRSLSMNISLSCSSRKSAIPQKCLVWPGITILHFLSCYSSSINVQERPTKRSPLPNNQLLKAQEKRESNSQSPSNTEYFVFLNESQKHDHKFFGQLAEKEGEGE
ncbi:hypothetical protein pdam_00024986 [Pocillopora damicornis]|uniref:Myb/SANT-like DNA-binding domain-containing protein n=1 Tax=Pocillopora damicornis TaxID=46731 RepID=A0A3M6UQT2_POCDA|nr:hypothetical protein pdam_00024986 [Pocillopora damicornis]